MDDETGPAARKLTLTEASAAVTDLGWRLVLGVLITQVAVTSVAAAASVAATAAAAAGSDADGHLWLDIRRDRVVVNLQSLAVAAVTSRDAELAGRISAAVAELGMRTEPGVGGQAPRTVQLVEIAVDALDIPSIRPFWKAALAYVDDVGASGPAAPLVDPVGQGPAVWFQQMDAPRPQRNRIHVDISVAHDAAEGRIAAALAAGGKLVSDTKAPAFWVLADVEGNEVCVTTWQGRD